MDDQEFITAIENVQQGIDIEKNFHFIYYRSYPYVENRIRFYLHRQESASCSTEDIEAITQDVYIYMSTHLAALKDPKAFWDWTDKIVEGKTADFFDLRLGKTISDKNAPDTQTDEDDDRNQTIAAVRKILDDLTDAQRGVIIPFFLYNKKEQEIAEELNLNLNTVKSRLKNEKTPSTSGRPLPKPQHPLRKQPQEPAKPKKESQ